MERAALSAILNSSRDLTDKILIFYMHEQGGSWVRIATQSIPHFCYQHLCNRCVSALPRFIFATTASHQVLLPKMVCISSIAPNYLDTLFV